MSRRCLAIVAALTLVVSARSRAAVRWIQHVSTHPPLAGEVSTWADVLYLPETAGHWVHVVWYDFSAGVWAYDTNQPYQFSSGAVQFKPPQFNRWDVVFVYDVNTGLFY